MTMPDVSGLPENLDVSYADDPANPGRKAHQQHHDLLHGAAKALLPRTEASATYVAKVPAATGVAATDTAAITSAFTGAAGRRGRVVLGGGEYAINATLNLPLLVSLDLAGSTLKAADGTNLPAVLQTEGWAALTGTGSSAGMTRNRISHGVIDGNKAGNPTGGVACRLYGWAYEVHDVIFQNAKGRGLTTEYGADLPTTGLPPGVQMEAVYSHVRCLSNDGDGWQHSGPHDSIVIGYTGMFNLGKGWTDMGGPAGSNAAGTHVLNMNCYSNSGTAVHTGGGMVGQDIAVSGVDTAPALLIDANSAPSRIGGLTAQSVEVRSGQHQISGLIVNGVGATETALKFGASVAGCIFDLKIQNCRQGVDFTNDGGGNILRVSVSTGAGQSAYTGTPGSNTTVLLVSEGADARKLNQSASSVKSNSLVHANINTGTEVVIGAFGPGGEAAIDLFGIKLYRSSPFLARLNQSLQIDGSLFMGAASVVQTGRAVTASRPAPGGSVGAMFYDTTLAKPIFSDGTVWRDAAGTAV